MVQFVPVTCPYCGEPSEVDVDEGGGSRQSLIQDCPVCCQPWNVEIARDCDGEWTAHLRTNDE